MLELELELEPARAVALKLPSPVDERVDENSSRGIRRSTGLERTYANHEALVEHTHLDRDFFAKSALSRASDREREVVDAVDRKVEARAKAAEHERDDAGEARSGGNRDGDRVHHDTVSGCPWGCMGTSKEGLLGLRSASRLLYVSPADFTVTTGEQLGMTVVRVVGELDLSTVPCFDGELSACLGTGRVVVDLTECSFIDSSALRSLVVAKRAADEAGGSFGLVAPTPAIRRVLQVASLDQVIQVADTVEELLAPPR